MWYQRGPVWVIGRRSSAYMASILALISAVLMPPLLRRTGGREVIEDAGIIEAVVMRALPFIVSADSAHRWCAIPSQ
ncbi:hypothetical protein [Rhodococcus wratislaviensis]|uniref:hypothetical protein n=1 Tax=Rhodococcus wratislaviensis TaxID=44752 RepID=UPI00351748B3